MPFATNSGDSRRLYELRRLYSESYETTIPESIDFRNKRYYYGRVDLDFDPVLPRLSEFKAVQQEGPEAQAFNFVVDAYEDMMRYINRHIKRGGLGSNYQSSFIGDMTVKRGWVSANTAYDDYLSTVNHVYQTSYLTTEDKASKISEIDDYVEGFIDFYVSMGYVYPLTKSGFILSGLTSPNSSGLCLEIAEKDHSNDQIKVDEFYNSPYFSFYVKTARKYGFVIDKNAPWRLVANLSSPLMMKYMARYGILRSPTREFFTKYYLKAYPYDIEILKRQLIHYYNEYGDRVPEVNVSKIIKCANSVQTRNVVVEREPAYYVPEKHKDLKLDENEEDLSFRDDFWIDKYYMMNLLESGIEKTPWIKEQELIKIFTLKNTLDITATMRYIKDITKTTHRRYPGAPPPLPGLNPPYHIVQRSPTPRPPTLAQENTTRGPRKWKLAPTQKGTAPVLIPRDSE